MESEFSHISLLSAFPDATDAFSETSIVYYSNKDVSVQLTLLKHCLTFYLAR